MIFAINNIEFNVGVVSMQRNVKKTYKYDVTTEDGVRHTEVKAIYPEYTLVLGSIEQTEYDSLREAINTYNETVSVTLPDGQRLITFDAVAELGGDSLVFIESDGTKHWDNITISFSGVNPIGDRG